MKVVLHLSDLGSAVEAADLARLTADVASLAEEGGVDGIAVGDHLWRRPSPDGPEIPCLEAYTTLGFLAARTEKVRLMTVATGVHFRHPAVLAKTVTTLDVLSGGRAWLGIGVGRDAAEAEGLGVPFPPVGVRYDLVEDAIGLSLRMWEGTGSEAAPGSAAEPPEAAGPAGPAAVEPFEGHHVRAARPLNLPQSLQRPHPPILIAGEGERRTLPLVARYGDACSLMPSPEIPRKLDVLRRLCDDAGTDFDRIERTCAYAFAVDDGGPQTAELLESLKGLAEAGIDTVIGRVDGAEARAPVEHLVRHVVPAAAEMASRRD
jgi:alkanesulfonate monooxygenase SsuD/methylene tetrahydromethanopterin reductase-like flavin-dependent oxidoreductase (luciferase family)